MKPIEGTWLKGPALGILLKFDGLKAGDFVKLGGWVPYGESKTVVVITVWHRHKRMTVLLGQMLLNYHYENIRAWMRKPLDLEL